MADPILAAVLDELHKLKRMAERAMAQLRDEDFFFRLNGDQNSVYVIVKHLAGNMRSRWTDFRTADGEKPDRNRDEEFVERTGVARAEIMATWERGWACTFAAVGSVRPEELGLELVRIRGERMTVFAAINRQTSHYAYHVGQIVLLAKHVRGADWQYLTIPRGQSEQYNRRAFGQAST